jgi:hypothetical protein
MRDRLGVQDSVSIKIIRGTPEIFYVVRPIDERLKISKECPIPYMRYDDYVEFMVMAHSQDEAEQIVNKVLND